MSVTEVVICGNSETGITQTSDSKQLHLYAENSRVLTVENGLLRVYARTSRVKGADVTAANTTTLPINGTLFHVLGDTTIKYLTTTNWSAGSAVILIFKGAPLVENGAADVPADTAKIYLDAGANFQTQVNSTLSIVYDGENWFEMCHKL